MADVTVLDSEYLKKFIQEHVEKFSVALEAMLKHNEVTDAKPISYISDGRTNTTLKVTSPLIIGLMAAPPTPGGTDDPNKAGGAGGGELNTVIQKSAGEILRIFEDQKVLFEDIKEALEETIKELAESQGKNLESIAANEFLDIFEDVDSDFGNSGENSGGSGSGSGSGGGED
ncbi:type VII secretion system-associated protein [Streptomyces sp. NPDC020766]|uniref:type VII secretion system-associated protein n=1 Tax=Streptomyces sp. NPDC020766 TaxID=3155011 RepID=UPI0033ECBCB5